MYQFRQYFAYKWPQNSKISALLAAFFFIVNLHNLVRTEFLFSSM